MDAGDVNCQDDASGGGNSWVGNTYTDFRDNPGWPTNFQITGLAGAIDWDGMAPGEAAIYGFNNTPGSMLVVSGRPAIGTTLTLGIDNPLGTQTAGATLGIFLFAPLADFNYPNGTPTPGMGMDGGFAETLVNLSTVDFSLSTVGGIWAGAGSPVTLSIPITDDPSVVGLTMYCQGLMFDPVGTITFGLTRGVDLSIGY